VHLGDFESANNGIGKLDGRSRALKVPRTNLIHVEGFVDGDSQSMGKYAQPNMFQHETRSK